MHQQSLINDVISPRVTVPGLVGQFVYDTPVTVEPTGSTAVVVGNAIINDTLVAGSMVQVNCSRIGQRVYVDNNTIINQGDIPSMGGDSGMLVVTCTEPGPITVDITNNRVINSGRIN